MRDALPGGSRSGCFGRSWNSLRRERPSFAKAACCVCRAQVSASRRRAGRSWNESRALLQRTLSPPDVKQIEKEIGVEATEAHSR